MCNEGYTRHLPSHNHPFPVQFPPKGGTGLRRAWAIICLALFQLSRWCQFAPGFLCAMSLQIPFWGVFFFPTSGITSLIALPGIKAHLHFKRAYPLHCLTRLSAGRHWGGVFLVGFCFCFFLNFWMLVTLLLQARSMSIYFGSMASKSSSSDIKKCVLSGLERAGAHKLSD